MFLIVCMYICSDILFAELLSPTHTHEGSASLSSSLLYISSSYAYLFMMMFSFVRERDIWVSREAFVFELLWYLHFFYIAF